jgi:hypothetical protein
MALHRRGNLVSSFHPRFPERLQRHEKQLYKSQPGSCWNFDCDPHGDFRLAHTHNDVLTHHSVALNRTTLLKPAETKSGETRQYMRVPPITQPSRELRFARWRLLLESQSSDAPVYLLGFIDSNNWFRSAADHAQSLFKFSHYGHDSK